MSTSLGISGAIAKKFLHSQITPLLALVGLLLGFFAVLVTPQEEEPQINVTFANVFVAFPGATAAEVEQLISTPGEQLLAEIEGVKHVYSVSRPGEAILTVEFTVGEDRNSSIVKLYNAIYSNKAWLPAHLGVSQPLIKPKGIDDVPVVTLTLWSDKPQWSGAELQRVAHAIEAELQRVPGTREIYTVGGPEQRRHVRLDPQRLAGYNLDIHDLRRALQTANSALESGALLIDQQEVKVTAGHFLTHADEVADLVVGMSEEGPIYLRDVAEIHRSADQPERYSWLGVGAAAATKGLPAHGEFPAVTLAIAKKPGANAAMLAEQIIERFNELRGIVVPADVNMTITRNYGETAQEKANTLLLKLAFATACVVLLVGFTLGWREAFIVGTAVVITLAITLFASWAWGFTINRVSLFALIFSIGILVDDAIVVVENIHRHRSLSGATLAEVIPRAVDEVGGPTILATFTVIAALLPMAFVTGLMGPYMSPIPINASMGMVISLAVAFILTPWLTLKLLHKGSLTAPNHTADATVDLQGGRMLRLFTWLMAPFITGAGARGRRWGLLLVIMVLIALSLGLVAMKLVVLKMLPFDNKSEFQVVVDMPEGVTLEETARVTQALGMYIGTVAEVTDYQAYVGTASPINFNGLMRQYYLRQGANVADIQVNLLNKQARSRKSHEIAAAMREPLQAIARRYSANVKIVEVPPGPPVQSPLVAEVYGIDHAGQIAMAKKIRAVFEQTADVVDVDDSLEAPATRLWVKIDRHKAAYLGLNQQQIVEVIKTAVSGDDLSFLHDPTAKYAVPIRLEFPVALRADVNALLNLKLRAQSGALIPVGEVVSLVNATREQTIYHKDLLPVIFITGDVAGKIDSPLYGLFDIYATLNQLRHQGEWVVDQYLFSQPANTYQYGLKWDGEWQITYETFRDMGMAYGVGLILIYLLVVAQFRSYFVPLMIMAPIPLTIIGVMPGHALLSSPFTATSMIGMIALAGIIVRNSILLVDFINSEVAQGRPLQEAVIVAGAVRAKPILLTALAAMLGALFILDDPIFNGLAIALIFGIMVSTLLTLLVIPLLYYAFMRQRAVS